MIVSTKAIVIKNIPYKESSSIVSLYTEAFGLKSYIIKGGRKKNAQIKSSLFQPLQSLDVVVYDNNKTQLQTIKEASLLGNNTLIHQDIIRTTLAIFLTEVISLSIREENPDADLFQFLNQSIENLNTCEEKSLKDFHLYFLYDFAKILGFEPVGLNMETNSKQERNDLLGWLLAFYQQYITNSLPIQSHQILRTIL